jgi:hypothetical protein
MMSADAASASGESTMVTMSEVFGVMSYAAMRSTPADRNPRAIVEPASPKPMKPITWPSCVSLVPS